MDIKYEDIDNISYAICTANVLLYMKIGELEKKDTTM